MRHVILAILAILLLPVALAHQEAPADETLAFGPSHGEGTVFLKVCFVKVGVPEASFRGVIDECLASGLYENTNGFSHLQVASGVAQKTENGAFEVYQPDASLLS